MKKITFCLLITAALGTLAGCQSQDTTNTKKTGSYTAARRNTLGSHIPQPYSADSTGSTVDTDAFMRDQQRMSGSAGSVANTTGGR